MRYSFLILTIVLFFVEIMLGRGCIFVMYLVVIKCMEKRLIYALILGGIRVNDPLFVIGRIVANVLLDQTNFRYALAFELFKLPLYPITCMCYILCLICIFRDTIEPTREKKDSSVMSVPNDLCAATTCKNMWKLTWNKNSWYGVLKCISFIGSFYITKYCCIVTYNNIVLCYTQYVGIACYVFTLITNRQLNLYLKFSESLLFMFLINIIICSESMI